jgi:outer membrane protein assembly factor BamB
MNEDAKSNRRPRTASRSMAGPVIEQSRPFILPAQPAPTARGEQVAQFRLRAATNPLPDSTLGDVGLAVRVMGQREGQGEVQGERLQAILMIPFVKRDITGVDPMSMRVFLWDERAKALQPVWNSGVNSEFGFIWAKIGQPGLYLPIGLPRDPVLREMLRELARSRRLAGADAERDRQFITDRVLAPLVEAAPGDLEALRGLLAQVDIHAGGRKAGQHEIEWGHGGHVRGFRLPGNTTLEDLQKRLSSLKTPPGGLPEESLFYPPETSATQAFSDAVRADYPNVLDRVDRLVLERLRLGDDFILRFPICWLFSTDWPMYHHDEQHTGHASGCSDITSTNVGGMTLLHKVPVDGPVITVPSVVQGKIYVGTSDNPGGGGTLHKIDLLSGIKEASFPVSARIPAYSQGVGGSPSIVDGRAYFTAIPGRVYCVDATTLANPPIWVTDLRYPDPAHNQPVQNHQDPSNPADSWSSPLVVNGKVYVGCGEGEGNTFGFVYCLDTNTGNVIWLFCTNKFTAGADNAPNVIPNSAVGITPLPAGFSSHVDPPQIGVSVWSSCAYDRTLNRIYVGTGNARSGDANPLPDPYYGSGVLALDADTGQFKGFFQPSASDSYRPDDTDVDLPSSPTLFTRGGRRVLGIGSKNGSFFLLDADTMAPLARRQLLPYRNDNPANPLPGVDPHSGPGENMFGIFGTAAVHSGLRRLFVGVGGYGGAIDTATTPFMRALDWETLDDAWTTTVGGDGVRRYTVPRPPMYTTPGEVGLSSPAVVNDVVFVSTTKPALYALDAATGLCLWPAPGITSGDYILGPAIYGNYVIIGSGADIYIYTLRRRWPPYPLPQPIPPWWYWIWWRVPPPPPPPDPFQEMPGGLTGFGGT